MPESSVPEPLQLVEVIEGPDVRDEQAPRCDERVQPGEHRCGVAQVLQRVDAQHQVGGPEVEPVVPEVALHQAQAVVLDPLGRLRQRVLGDVDPDDLLGAGHSQRQLYELAGAAAELQHPRRTGRMLLDELDEVLLLAQVVFAEDRMLFRFLPIPEPARPILLAVRRQVAERSDSQVGHRLSEHV